MPTLNQVWVYRVAKLVRGAILKQAKGRPKNHLLGESMKILQDIDTIVGEILALVHLIPPHLALLYHLILKDPCQEDKPKERKSQPHSPMRTNQSREVELTRKNTKENLHHCIVDKNLTEIHLVLRCTETHLKKSIRRLLEEERCLRSHLINSLPRALLVNT